MTEPEFMLIALTGLVALANLLAAIAAVWNARVLKRSVDLARKEFALSRAPTVRLRLTDDSVVAYGKQQVAGELHETSGHQAYIHEVTGTLEELLPIRPDGPVVEYRIVGRPWTIKPGMTVGESTFLPVFTGAMPEDIDSLRPTCTLRVRFFYTLSNEHVRWRRETWLAEFPVIRHGGELHRGRVGHHFQHDTYSDDEGWLRRAVREWSDAQERWKDQVNRGG